jgi:hypothetical protein
LKSAIEVHVLELINAVEGNPNHSHTLINSLEALFDKILNEYAREMEIEVEFSCDDAEEPDEYPSEESDSEA